MRGDYYGKLQLMRQPSETREIWRTRSDELEPSPEWGLLCFYEHNPIQSFEDKDFVQKLLLTAGLTPREEKVVRLCIFEDYTLEDASKNFDSWTHTKERIRQIKTKAIRKLLVAAYKLT
jgi:hypothetical protein